MQHRKTDKPLSVRMKNDPHTYAKIYHSYERQMG